MLECLLSVLVWAIFALIVLLLIESVLAAILDPRPVPPKIVALVRLLIALIVLIQCIDCLGLFSVPLFHRPMVR